MAVKAYRPMDFHTPGTYRINVGPFFYIGSSYHIGSRVSEHRCNLEAGTHPNQALQSAWGEHGQFEAFILMIIPRKDHDMDKDHCDRLRFHEELLLRDLHGTEGCCNTSSTAYYNSTVGDNLKARWEDPEYRAKMIEVLKNRRFSDESKRKMAEAKRGKRNPNARACIVTFGGERKRFESATQAAAHYGVTQQAMEGWLSGKNGWPTAGGKTRQQNRRLAGMTGKYA